MRTATQEKPANGVHRVSCGGWAVWAEGRFITAYGTKQEADSSFVRWTFEYKRRDAAK